MVTTKKTTTRKAAAKKAAPAQATADITREAWLQQASTMLLLRMEAAGTPMAAKPFRTSVGWPKGARGRRKAIGQAWSAISSADKHAEIFISPELADAYDVLHVLAHELCHVADANLSGHKKPFALLAQSMLLQKPWTATTPATGEGEEWYKSLVAALPAYPHAKLHSTDGPKKQRSRMRKVVCVDKACGCALRMTAKWLEEVGTPTCACGEEMEAAPTTSEG